MTASDICDGHGLLGMATHWLRTSAACFLQNSETVRQQTQHVIIEAACILTNQGDKSEYPPPNPFKNSFFQAYEICKFTKLKFSTEIPAVPLYLPCCHLLFQPWVTFPGSRATRTWRSLLLCSILLCVPWWCFFRMLRLHTEALVVKSEMIANFDLFIKLYIKAQKINLYLVVRWCNPGTSLIKLGCRCVSTVFSWNRGRIPIQGLP